MKSFHLNGKNRSSFLYIRRTTKWIAQIIEGSACYARLARSFRQLYSRELKLEKRKYCQKRTRYSVTTEVPLTRSLHSYSWQRSTIYEECGKDLYVCYIDFREALESIWRKDLWNVMRRLGCPEKIIQIFENANRDTFSAVRVDGELSEWFITIVGVLQGCVLSPRLFNIFLEMVIALAGEDMEIGAVINGLRIGNLRFAGDIAALADNETDLQIQVGRIAEVSKKWDAD